MRRQNADDRKDDGRQKTERRRDDRTQNTEVTEEKTQTEGRDDAHVGRDVPGGDPVHLHVLPAPFVAERLGQLPERALGRGVRRHCEPALEVRRRGRVDADVAGGRGGERSVVHGGGDRREGGGGDTVVHPTRHNSTRISYRSRRTQRNATHGTERHNTGTNSTNSAHRNKNKKVIVSTRRGVAGYIMEWGGGLRLVRTWKVNNEQKLTIFPRRRGTMCCPAACESSHTDLRFTFRTCACQYR